MKIAQGLSREIQSAASWRDGEITLPAFLWEQLYNSLNPGYEVHDFTEPSEPANVYSRREQRSA